MKARISPAARRWFTLVLVTALAACAPPPSAPKQGGLSGPDAGDLQRILAPPRPPKVLAAAGQGARISARAARRLTFAALSEQRGARQVQIAAVPLLRSTPEGLTFLNMTGHRALAQGEPAASCPALSVAPATAPNAVAAAEVSLSQCQAQLKARGAPTTCGCRLIALDNALLAPIGQFSFAPAVSALIIERGKATRLIAEADVRDGIALTRLRDANGEVGILRGTAGSDRITGQIGDVAYTGTRKPFGFRRGRLAERITLTNDTGTPISVLIGVERRDATPK